MLTITVFSMDQAYELIERFSTKFDHYKIETKGMAIIVRMYNK